MNTPTMQLSTFLILLVNVLMLVFVMLQISRQSRLIKQLIEKGIRDSERANRIRTTQKIMRKIHKHVFEGYSNARGQPRMATDFLATYSTMESELDSLVALIDDKQLSAFVEQGIMPEAPSATGDWTAQLGKKTKLVKHIHSRLYELLEEDELSQITIDGF